MIPSTIQSSSARLIDNISSSMSSSSTSIMKKDINIYSSFGHHLHINIIESITIVTNNTNDNTNDNTVSILSSRDNISTKSSTVFTWPCAQLLSAYLTSLSSITSSLLASGEEYDGIKDKIFIELSAGTALPSITAAKLGAKKCYCTEKSDDKQIFDVMRQSMLANDVESKCFACPLDWGSTEFEFDYMEADYILGADIFYSSENFSDIVRTIAMLLKGMKSEACCYCTYQERSVQRTLRPHLDRYGLCANVVDNRSFLHISHFEGECLFQRRSVRPRLEQSPFEPSEDELVLQTVPVFDNIVLLKICRKTISKEEAPIGIEAV